MPQKFTLSHRIRYHFDNFMSRGTPALILGLFILSVLMIFLAAGLVKAVGAAPEGVGFFELMWMSLLRTLDSGTMGGDTGSAFFLFMMLMVTLGGIFIVSALIGVLNTGLESKLEELRKGRSFVLEQNHTLILGWSTQIFTILSELMIANENQKNARIVILADRDKVEMEDEIRGRVKTLGSTRIICRSGNPIDLNDLEIVNPHSARAIIILPSEEGGDDSQVIKTILAITNNPKRRKEPYLIVTQVKNPKNMEVVRMVGANDKLFALLSGDMIARIVAQTSRQSGLSVVYTELLNFGGDEIYFKHEPVLTSKTYGEALFAYEDSCVMGICKADGTILLNPPMDEIIEAGDSIFALAQDDDTIRLSGQSSFPIDLRLIRTDSKVPQPQAEKCLILGWNQNADTIVRELDHYVAPGSQITVVDSDRQVETHIQRLYGDLKNQSLAFQEGEPSDRDLLDRLNISEYDHVIVLADDGLDPQKADARTLVTLLHLRDIAEKFGTSFSIVSEMLDLRNRELAEVTRVDDFIVSEHLISLMMAQLAENDKLYYVLTDIFDPAGSEIYLKPASEYVQTGVPVNFYTVLEAARRRGETAIGYRLMSEASEPEKSYGVHTNPKKSNLIPFSEQDKIIVLAE